MSSCRLTDASCAPADSPQGLRGPAVILHQARLPRHRHRRQVDPGPHLAQGAAHEAVRPRPAFRALARAATTDPELFAPPRREQAESGLHFLGLIVFENKLKPETTPAISVLRGAHLTCRMVSAAQALAGCCDSVLTLVSRTPTGHRRQRPDGRQRRPRVRPRDAVGDRFPALVHLWLALGPRVAHRLDVGRRRRRCARRVLAAAARHDPPAESPRRRPGGAARVQPGRHRRRLPLDGRLGPSRDVPPRASPRPVLLARRLCASR